MEILWLCFMIFATGACIGSFLNVVALRALTDESIVLPASKCPNCNAKIKWYDNIPIFSYLFTFKGKCRNCHQKVSIQYPIVETLTALIFLFVCVCFGFTLKSLFLLILFSISIVIAITDIKQECIFERHAWCLIIMSVLTSLLVNGLENYSKTAIGLIAGVILMETLAKLSYYLVRKKTEPEKTTNNSSNDDIDINEYVNKNKRAFGEGDTYLAAASGALLGWQALLITLFLSIILQSLLVLPKFLIGLYKQKQYTLIAALSAFIVITIVYWGLSNTVHLNNYVVYSFVVVLIFLAILTIKKLKYTVNEQGFSPIPFGPAILSATFIVFFFGRTIVDFLIKYIC